ncbi:response regulator [Planctobacterium marinum]|uniref:Response regulatory domain-containing protein n=1 Tax=Planctobacterium marinum TaxID=1631968 RepID=A0AA48KMY1_9ALTE|nr:hypothetical protein MACH26_04420 [Planctobacterium marinum]
MFDTKNLKVLILEDEYVQALYLRECLEELGIQQINVITNAEKADALLQQKRPDIAFLDIRMKDQDLGIEIASLCKGVGVEHVVFTSSFTDEDTLQRAMSVASDGFLLKPYDASNVKVQVFLCLARSGSTDEC